MKKHTGKRQNVIVLIIDALRRSDLGCYGSRTVRSPNIDELAARSILFENAFSTANCTDPAVTSLLSGRFPANHGITTHGKEVTGKHRGDLKRSETKFIQEILRKANYRTIGIDFLGRWHRRGFEEYLSIEEKKSITDRVMDAAPKRVRSFYHDGKQRLGLNYGMNIKRDMEYTNIAIGRIKEIAQRKEQFFMLVHYWGVHIPYEPLKGRIGPSDLIDELPDMDPISEASGPWKDNLVRLMGNERDLRSIVARYYSCIEEIDLEIGKLMNAIEEAGIMDDTLILLTSDHGESLYEHGIMFDHHGLYDVSIRVPMVLHIPGEKGKRICPPVQHIDVVPTVLEHLGIEHGELDGFAMQGLMHGEGGGREAIYTEENYTQRKRSVRTEEFKYIIAEDIASARCRYCDRIHGGVEELYDLVSDPEETENLVEEETEVVEIMKGILRSYQKRTGRDIDRSKIASAIGRMKGPSGRNRV